jgi:hypothetical protein
LVDARLFAAGNVGFDEGLPEGLISPAGEAGSGRCSLTEHSLHAQAWLIRFSTSRRPRNQSTAPVGEALGPSRTPMRFSPRPSTRKLAIAKTSQLHAPVDISPKERVRRQRDACRFVGGHRHRSVVSLLSQRPVSAWWQGRNRECNKTNLRTNDATKAGVFRTCVVLLLSGLLNVHLHNLRLQSHATGTLLAQRPADSLLLTASNLDGSAVARNRTLPAQPNPPLSEAPEKARSCR